MDRQIPHSKMDTIAMVKSTMGESHKEGTPNLIYSHQNPITFFKGSISNVSP
jgi:hypothetical protein